MAACLPADSARRPRARPRQGRAAQIVQATTVNKVCGSGMQPSSWAPMRSPAGRSDMVVAGGMESMTTPRISLRKSVGRRIVHDRVYDHIFLTCSRTPTTRSAMALPRRTPANEYHSPANIGHYSVESCAAQTPRSRAARFADRSSRHRQVAQGRGLGRHLRSPGQVNPESCAN